MKRVSMLGVTVLVGLAMVVLAGASTAAGEDLPGGSHAYSEQEFEELEVNGKRELYCFEDTAYENERGEWSGWSWIHCGDRPGQACQTEGAVAGEVKWNNLAEKVANVDYAEDEMGVEFSKAKGAKDLLNFSCGSTAWEVKGAVIGQVTPIGTLTENFTLAFTAEGAAQSITHFEGKTKAVGLEARKIEGKKKGKWEPAVLRTTEHLTAPMMTELKLEKPRR